MKHCDFFGNNLEVGDYVVFQCRTARRFEFAKVCRITPQNYICIVPLPFCEWERRGEVFKQEGRQLIKSTKEAYEKWRKR